MRLAKLTALSLVTGSVLSLSFEHEAPAQQPPQPHFVHSLPKSVNQDEAMPVTLSNGQTRMITRREILRHIDPSTRVRTMSGKTITLQEMWNRFDELEHQAGKSLGDAFNAPAPGQTTAGAHAAMDGEPAATHPQGGPHMASPMLGAQAQSNPMVFPPAGSTFEMAIGDRRFAAAEAGLSVFGVANANGTACIARLTSQAFLGNKAVPLVDVKIEAEGGPRSTHAAVSVDVLGRPAFGVALPIGSPAHPVPQTFPIGPFGVEYHVPLPGFLIDVAAKASLEGRLSVPLYATPGTDTCSIGIAPSLNVVGHVSTEVGFGANVAGNGFDVAQAGIQGDVTLVSANVPMKANMTLTGAAPHPMLSESMSIEPSGELLKSEVKMFINFVNPCFHVNFLLFSANVCVLPILHIPVPHKDWHIETSAGIPLSHWLAPVHFSPPPQRL